jgi:hypothetical protein
MKPDLGPSAFAENLVPMTPGRWKTAKAPYSCLANWYS